MTLNIWSFYLSFPSPRIKAMLHQVRPKTGMFKIEDFDCLNHCCSGDIVHDALKLLCVNFTQASVCWLCLKHCTACQQELWLHCMCALLNYNHKPTHLRKPWLSHSGWFTAEPVFPISRLMPFLHFPYLADKWKHTEPSYGREREPTPQSCPLPSTCTLWHVHAPTYIHTQ